MSIIIVFSLSCSFPGSLAAIPLTSDFFSPGKSLIADLPVFTVEVGLAADHSQGSRREQNGNKPHVELESSPATVEMRHDRVILRAQEAVLGEFLAAIRRECSVEISGLAARANERITLFVEEETVEKGLKRLLKHLGETNYAFVFQNDALTRISVFPKGKKDVSLQTQKNKQHVSEEGLASVVRIQKIVEGSQAEAFGLTRGDLIIAYDGVRIEKNEQLVAEVKKKKDKSHVNLLIVRDGRPLEFVLNGGFIGVNIISTKIPKEEFDSYYAN
jgi:C-terminal processing protease CtpA/Prc